MVFLSSRSPFTRVSSPLLVSSLLQKPQPSIEKPLSNASFPLMWAGYTVRYPTQTPTDYTRPQPQIHLVITNTASAPLSSLRRVLGQPLCWRRFILCAISLLDLFAASTLFLARLTQFISALGCLYCEPWLNQPLCWLCCILCAIGLIDLFAGSSQLARSNWRTSLLDFPFSALCSACV
jgi:hypothetical protein